MKTKITITSGTGPRETRQFVQLLADRIRHLCDEANLAVTQTVYIGSQNAPRSIHYTTEGDVRTLLSNEIGTHCLVARSDRRGRRGRKRWFAGVTIREEKEVQDSESMVDQRDLKITTCRAGGPGGQHVNKTSSAVLALHRPSGISVKVMEQRSQQINRVIAIERIAHELQRRKEKIMMITKSENRRGHYQLERGNPVREYRIGRNGKLESLNGSMQS